MEGMPKTGKENKSLIKIKGSLKATLFYYHVEINSIRWCW